MDESLQGGRKSKSSVIRGQEVVRDGNMRGGRRGQAGAGMNRFGHMWAHVGKYGRYRKL